MRARRDAGGREPDGRFRVFAHAATRACFHVRLFDRLLAKCRNCRDRCLARRREVGEPAPALRAELVGVDGADRSLRAAHRRSRRSGRSRTRRPCRRAPAGSGRASSTAACVSRSSRKRAVFVSMPALRPPSAKTRVPRGSGGEMLAGRGPGDPRPAARAQVESEGDPRQRAAAVDASEHVELAARDRGRCCGAAVRERREAAPAPILEHEGGVERGAVAAVAADDVDASVRARRRGVVDRDGQVGQPPPAVARDRVGVDACRVAAVRDEAAHGDDLAAGDACDDLGPRLRERRVALPGSRGGDSDGHCQDQPGGERSSQNR